MIQFTENGIRQELGSIKKNWTVPELLEAFEPLSGEALSVRNGVMKVILPMAEERYGELSEAARLRYDFWKQLLPQRIAEQKFNYTTKISNTYQWELTINPEGLFYKDISPEYSQMQGTVHEQLFSDFWFFGPLLPIPDLQVRKQLVANIRNAFAQAGSPAADKHFELFEYPMGFDGPYWKDGDHHAEDYGIVRKYGIEIGRTTWRDGLVYSFFISFEQFLARPDRMEKLIPDEARAEIEKYLDRRAKRPQSADAPGTAYHEASKRLFMENGGNVHNIGRDGFMDEYKATAADEAAWRAELIENCTLRLGEEDNETVLASLAETLEYNGVENVGERFCEAAKTATPKAQQAIAELLIKKLDAEKGAEVLIDLLKYEEAESYWRNYVFNRMFRLRENRTVQQFVVQCLRGDHEIHFKKAVDVLAFWGMQGEKPFQDVTLLRALNWDDACAADPDFNEAMDKVIRLIQNSIR